MKMVLRGTQAGFLAQASRREKRRTRHKAISIFPADEAPIKAPGIKIQRLPALEIA